MQRRGHYLLGFALQAHPTAAGQPPSNWWQIKRFFDAFEYTRPDEGVASMLPVCEIFVKELPILDFHAQKTCVELISADIGD